MTYHKRKDKQKRSIPFHILEFADREVKAAIITMPKDIKENTPEINKKIRNLSREKNILKGN